MPKANPEVFPHGFEISEKVDNKTNGKLHYNHSNVRSFLRYLGLTIKTLTVKHIKLKF